MFISISLKYYSHIFASTFMFISISLKYYKRYSLIKPNWALWAHKSAPAGPGPAQGDDLRRATAGMGHGKEPDTNATCSGAHT